MRARGVGGTHQRDARRSLGAAVHRHPLGLSALTRNRLAPAARREALPAAAPGRIGCWRWQRGGRGCEGAQARGAAVGTLRAGHTHTCIHTYIYIYTHTVRLRLLFLRLSACRRLPPLGRRLACATTPGWFRAPARAALRLCAVAALRSAAAGVFPTSFLRFGPS